MSNKGNWSIVVNTSVQLVLANSYRRKLSIQLYSITSGAVALGFGEPAEYGKGLKLFKAGDIISLAGDLSRENVCGITFGGATAVGGYQEHIGIID